MAKDTEKKVRPGAFVISERVDDPPMFDFALRVASQPAPPDQIKLAGDIAKFVNDIERSGIPLATQNEFIQQVRNLFFKGCVRESPDVGAASRELVVLERKLLVNEIIPRLTNSKGRESLKLLAVIVFLILAHFIVDGGLFSFLGKEAISAETYILVATGAVLGLLVVNNVDTPLSDISNALAFEAQIRTPFINAIGVVVVSFIVTIMIQLGVFSLKIGSMDTGSLGKDWKVALVIGFFLGVLKTEIIAVVLSNLKKRLGRNDLTPDLTSTPNQERR